MKGKKCIKLLILSIICLLSLSLYSNANATTWTGNWGVWDVNNWVSAGSGSFITVSNSFYTTSLRYIPPTPSFTLNKGRNITLTATFIALFDYNASGINSPLEFSCPLLRGPVTTLDCSLSSSTDVSGGQHFIVYTWTYTGYIYDTQTQTALNFDFYLKNNSPGAMRLYSTGITINSGDSDVQVNTEAIQSFNQDVSSYISSVITSLNTNQQTITSAIQSYNTDFNRYIQNLFNKIDSLSSDVSDINQYLQDKEDQEEEDRDNIEQQSSDNQDQADDAGDEATQTGTSLFSAFTQLLGALTNVNGTSCTLPTMQVYSLNLGNMNLCQYNIPPQIMALVSIGMVFIIVPLGIHLVKRMIALYKEITG